MIKFLLRAIRSWFRKSDLIIERGGSAQLPTNTEPHERLVDLLRRKQ
jgi:hypothetical protein